MAEVLGYTNERGEVSFRDPESGAFVWVPKAEATKAAAAGYVAETRGEYHERVDRERADNPVEAALVGAFRGLTLGGSDFVMRQANLGEHARLLREENPIASGIGEVGGTVVSSLIPGGPLARAAALGSRAGRAIGGAGKLGTALAAAGTGVAEGALVGAGQGVSQVALEGRGAEAIGKAALIGAATGGVLSLAGLGLAAAGRRVRDAALKRAGSSAPEMDALLASQRVLAQDARVIEQIGDKGAGGLIDSIRAGEAVGANAAAIAAARRQLGVKLGGWQPASGMPADKVASKLAEVTEEVARIRTDLFTKAGERLTEARGALGLAAGFGTESWLLGGLGFSAGGLISKAVGSKVGQRAIAASARALEALPAAGRVGKLGAISILSHEAVEALRPALMATDPAAIQQAALQGYQAGGVPPDHAQQLAGFQGARVTLLQEAIPRAGDVAGRVRFSRLYAAASNPRSIAARIETKDASREDVQVLQRALPTVAAALEAQARAELDRRTRAKAPLSAASRRLLELLANDDRRRRRAAIIQQALATIAEAKPPPPQSVGGGHLPTGQTPIQRMAARGGVLGKG